MRDRVLQRCAKIMDKFSGKVAFLVYAEMLKFRSQSWKTASKQKPDRNHSPDNGHVTH